MMMIQSERRPLVPILIALLVWLPALIGLGSVILDLHGRADENRPLWRFALSGLFGLFALSIVGTIANFFFAIHPVFPILALIGGFFLLFINRRSLLRGIGGSQVLTIIAISLLVALADARGRIRYDTGLYHLQAVKWITSQSTPLGLANLYGRLGFNCAWFPAAAMLEGPMLLGNSTFILNALLMVFFGLALIDSAAALLRQGFNRSDAFLVLSLYPWAAYGFDTDYVSSLQPDLPVMLLICLVGSLVLSEKETAVRIRQAITLSLFAAMIKLSAGPLLVGVLAIWIFRKGQGEKSRFNVFSLFSIWTLAVAAWLVRGVLLSGFLFYPLALGRIASLPWTVPVIRMKYEVELIRDWGRYWMRPEHLTPGQPWMRSWAIRLWTEPYASPQQIKLSVILLAGGILLILLPSPKKIEKQKWLPLLLISAVGISYWFWTAPDPRFGYGYIYAFVAAVFCIGLEKKSHRLRLLASLGCAAMFLFLLRSYFTGLTQIAIRQWPPIPRPTLVAQQNSQGITIYIPTHDDRPWTAPLPASPFFDPALLCTVDSKGRFQRFWLDPSQQPLAKP
jgi:hypothetical protein